MSFTFLCNLNAELVLTEMSHVIQLAFESLRPLPFDTLHDTNLGTMKVIQKKYYMLESKSYFLLAGKTRGLLFSFMFSRFLDILVTFEELFIMNLHVLSKHGIYI